MTDVLTRRELNRATLARQMLLARERAAPPRAVERLLAMQAQEARPPSIGLWSRLAGFQPAGLYDALHAREVVRATHVRATLHLLSAPDYLAFRMPVQPMLSAAAGSVIKRIGGAALDPAALLSAARAVLKDGPRTFTAIRELLRREFPEVNDRALGYVVRLHLPLVMVPTADRWAFPASAEFTLADLWLGAPPSPAESLEPFVLRYLAAYGPASAADMQMWTGLKRLRPVFEGLRPRLRAFRDEGGRELFDLPDAPRPAADTPAPGRLLPEFDSVLLAHADRTRIVSDEHRPHLITKNLRVPASFLWDGFVRGTWKATRRGGTATLTMTPFEPLPGPAVTELTGEARALLAWTDPDATTLDVRLDPPS